MLREDFLQYQVYYPVTSLSVSSGHVGKIEVYLAHTHSQACVPFFSILELLLISFLWFVDETWSHYVARAPLELAYVARALASASPVLVWQPFGFMNLQALAHSH
jgi:hypothetical protein